MSALHLDGSTAPARTELDDDDRAGLLALARHEIAARLGMPAPAVPDRPAFGRPGGAFVTVYVAGELRGCIGIPESAQPVGEVIAHCAAAAAFEDPRFPPIDASELDALGIEISLLGPLTPLLDVSHLEIGRHGLVVEQSWRRGLLLPQVATEHHWTTQEFLRHVCRKAGLPTDAWQHGAALWVFEADVISETRNAGRGTRN